MGGLGAFGVIACALRTCCGWVSASAAASPPSTPGAQVTFTGAATSTSCPSPLYQFWIMAPGSSTWTVAQAYSSSTTLAWNTSGKLAGTYRFSVWVRDSSSPGAFNTTLGHFDAFAVITYTLSST